MMHRIKQPAGYYLEAFYGIDEAGNIRITSTWILGEPVDVDKQPIIHDIKKTLKLEYMSINKELIQ